MTVVLVTAVVLLGQPVAGRLAAQAPPFRGGVDMVVLNVTATDASGHFATDLTRDDFAVYEEGRKQDILFFQRSNVPLSVALLIDTSKSMLFCLPEAQAAAIGLVQTLGPADLTSVMTFKTTVDALQTFTSDNAAGERDPSDGCQW
jgi:VWFA-related protein